MTHQIVGTRPAYFRHTWLKREVKKGVPILCLIHQIKHGLTHHFGSFPKVKKAETVDAISGKIRQTHNWLLPFIPNKRKSIGNHLHIQSAVKLMAYSLTVYFLTSKSATL
jgi:hypothetical protein